MKVIKCFLFLFFINCGSDSKPSTCTDLVMDLYSTPNCSMWNLSFTPPVKIPANEALVICRRFVSIIGSSCNECSGLLRDYLECRPTKCEWDNKFKFYMADDCNDEVDRLLECCSK